MPESRLHGANAEAGFASYPSLVVDRKIILECRKYVSTTLSVKKGWLHSRTAKSITTLQIDSHTFNEDNWWVEIQFEGCSFWAVGQRVFGCGSHKQTRGCKFHGNILVDWLKTSSKHNALLYTWWRMMTLFFIPAHLPVAYRKPGLFWTFSAFSFCGPISLQCMMPFIANQTENQLLFRTDKAKKLPN